MLREFGVRARLTLIILAAGIASPAVARHHSADMNHDYAINLGELLRVIQFFNSGGCHCETGTEDGFAPGMGPIGCTPHDSDYAPRDWRINLSELLRLVQYFESLGYHARCGSEDSFDPGPGDHDFCEGEAPAEGEGENPPLFITADAVTADHISCISYFRSSAGDDYSQGSMETCRSMKHYFTLKPDVDWRLEPVYSPVMGQITGLEAERLGSRMTITVAGQGDYRVIIAHMEPMASLSVGDAVVAGQPIGTYWGDNVNIAVHGPAALYSYFEVMTDEVFARYQAQGVGVREQLILSRSVRDANALECLYTFTPPRFLTADHLPSWFCLGEGLGEGEYIPPESQEEPPPRFVEADWVRVEHVKRISYFRSSAGNHTYSEGTPESCRSMKHYFELYPEVDFRSETIYAPVSGKVERLRPEENGTQIEIVVNNYPQYRVHIFHVALIPTITEGSRVRAGQPLGKFSSHETSIAVRGLDGLYSYFQVMTDAVFAGYQARGLISRSRLVIPKADRDNDPLECFEGVVPAQFLTHGHLPNWYSFDDAEGLSGFPPPPEKGAKSGGRRNVAE